MAISTDLSTKVIESEYVDLQGQPITGSVRFTPTSIIKDKDQNIIHVNQSITKVLDSNGRFSVTLPVTDDGDGTPSSLGYYVEELFTSGRSFYIEVLSSSTSPIELADTAAAVSTDEAVSYVTLTAYNTLLNRYNSADTIRDAIKDAAQNTATAKTNSETTATVTTDVSKRSLSNLLLMGL
jgi:hypothetical protein